jgi:hypothetical protein
MGNDKWTVHYVDELINDNESSNNQSGLPQIK